MKKFLEHLVLDKHLKNVKSVERCPQTEVKLQYDAGETR